MLNTFLEVELNHMHYEELLAQAERVRLARRARKGDGAGRASIVGRLPVSLKWLLLLGALLVAALAAAPASAQQFDQVQESLPASATHSSALYVILWRYLCLYQTGSNQ